MENKARGKKPAPKQVQLLALHANNILRAPALALTALNVKGEKDVRRNPARNTKWK